MKNSMALSLCSLYSRRPTINKVIGNPNIAMIINSTTPIPNIVPPFVMQ